jgi:hypothetical protein
MIIPQLNTKKYVTNCPLIGPDMPSELTCTVSCRFYDKENNGCVYHEKKVLKEGEKDAND